MMGAASSTEQQQGAVSVFPHISSPEIRLYQVLSDLSPLESKFVRGSFSLFATK